MNFLRKLFAKPEPKPAPAAGHGMSVPRATRVPLQALHSVRFTASEPASLGSLGISNLSGSGVGFLKRSSDAWPAVGATIAGTLTLGANSVPTRLRVVHAAGELVGATFVDEVESVRRAITDYFAVELAALRMNRVNPEMLQADPDGSPHWLYGDRGCELHFVTRADGSLVRFQLSFFGNHVEGDADGGVRAGQIVAEQDEKPRYRSSETLSTAGVDAAALRALARRFVESVAPLEPAERRALLDRLGT
jgi:hypothetical protein